MDYAIKTLRQRQAHLRDDAKTLRELRRHVHVDNSNAAKSTEMESIDKVADWDRELDAAIKVLERENK